jgi:hypothetical protein
MAKIHKKEPLVLIGLLASLVILVAGHFGIVLDHATVQTVLEPLAVSLLARPFVTPAVHGAIDAAEEVVEQDKV